MSSPYPPIHQRPVPDPIPHPPKQSTSWWKRPGPPSPLEPIPNYRSKSPPPTSPTASTSGGFGIHSLKSVFRNKPRPALQLPLQDPPAPFVQTVISSSTSPAPSPRKLRSRAGTTASSSQTQSLTGSHHVTPAAISPQLANIPQHVWKSPGRSRSYTALRVGEKEREREAERDRERGFERSYDRGREGKSVMPDMGEEEGMGSGMATVRERRAGRARDGNGPRPSISTTVTTTSVYSSAPSHLSPTSSLSSQPTPPLPPPTPTLQQPAHSETDLAALHAKARRHGWTLHLPPPPPPVPPPPIPQRGRTTSSTTTATTNTTATSASSQHSNSLPPPNSRHLSTLTSYLPYFHLGPSHSTPPETLLVVRDESPVVRPVSSIARPDSPLDLSSGSGYPRSASGSLRSLRSHRSTRSAKSSSPAAPGNGSAQGNDRRLRKPRSLRDVRSPAGSVKNLSVSLGPGSSGPPELRHSSSVGTVEPVPRLSDEPRESEDASVPSDVPDLPPSPTKEKPRRARRPVTAPAADRHHHQASQDQQAYERKHIVPPSELARLMSASPSPTCVPPAPSPTDRERPERAPSVRSGGESGPEDAPWVSHARRQDGHTPSPPARPPHMHVHTHTASPPSLPAPRRRQQRQSSLTHHSPTHSNSNSNSGHSLRPPAAAAPEYAIPPVPSLPVSFEGSVRSSSITRSERGENGGRVGVTRKPSFLNFDLEEDEEEGVVLMSPVSPRTPSEAPLSLRTHSPRLLSDGPLSPLTQPSRTYSDGPLSPRTHSLSHPPRTHSTEPDLSRERSGGKPVIAMTVTTAGGKGKRGTERRSVMRQKSFLDLDVGSGREGE